MILNKNFYKTPGLFERLMVSKKMKRFLKRDSFFSSLSLAQVRLPQFFFYSARLKTVPRFSGNLQLLSTWGELERLPGICPTNAISVSPKNIEIDEKRCIACGLCVEFSPDGLLLTGILDPEKKSHPET